MITIFFAFSLNRCAFWWHGVAADYPVPSPAIIWIRKKSLGRRSWWTANLFLTPPPPPPPPGLEKHDCHGMILPWSYHDHGETWSWSCHDNGMAAMFLSMVAMIHAMIMVWSSCFACFFLKKPLECFVNFFSNSSRHIPLYGTLDCL